MEKVNSIKQLKDMIHDGVHDFFMMLNYGLRSSKTLDYSPLTGIFYVLNEIDDTEQNLTEEQLSDEKLTNIGKAINAGAFFAY